ncbi:formate dehydrogenase [Devosia chinhatensis]|uniref:Sulfur carrier protein FdhD n=1 Tax=Devosia chinhatensis TaxID=429727 RepID=A0A0F5FP94_9HYPH|nr:formate dehydrogenase [Devosia chinhatensis]
MAVQRLGLATEGDAPAVRDVPVEAPIAIDIGGIGYAVMMATPLDLEDYLTGFMLSEGLIRGSREIGSLVISAVEGGWVTRVALPPDAMQKVMVRARRRVGESSCGLCGIDNIAEVLRPLPQLKARITTTRAAIGAALDELPHHQPLSRQTGAVHAAAFCTPDGQIQLVREDVGRHNALDKLIGALARAGMDPASGFFLLSARCSYELVEKTVRAGCPMLVTISAPTSLAVERARSAGLTLVALARPDAALVVSGAETIIA